QDLSVLFEGKAPQPRDHFTLGYGEHVWCRDDRYVMFVRGDMLIAAILALWVAGHLDDVLGGRARGLGGHLRSALRGRPTTGILKLVAGVAAGVGLALALGGGAVRVAAAAILVAVATNLWNALDVVPGRALKWGIVALVPLVAASWRGDYGIVGAATLGVAAAGLPFDLRERAMLGDAGSNPLGFVVGAGLALSLPTAGVVAAAAAALALQAAAETVTISRLVEAAPPLRWFDRLGRPE
ncbi:MAG TPA: hypothetical protein VHL78_00925, partial [Actinomycetota bacterium]|nr:hypothetical protein [Actinomycetota bacterium]